MALGGFFFCSVCARPSDHTFDARYGTGCFLLLNTGKAPVFSQHGLLTTAAYQLGPTAPVTYALEGSIAIAGAGVDWLINKMGLVADAKELNDLAASVTSTGDVYFVPAFNGLYAPHWRDDARGLIVGLTQFTERAHLCRALLEATCFQTREVLDAMRMDSGVQLKTLRVDGGMTKSPVLLQLQADLLNIDVERPDNGEATAMGAAYAAGLATGMWSDTAALNEAVGAGDTTQVVKPRAAEQAHVPARLARWSAAVQRSFGWANKTKN